MANNKTKNKTDKKFVWVFTAEQAWDDEAADIVVKAFGSEDAAQKYMHGFIHDGGSESIEQYVKTHEWEVEVDEPDVYRAYPEGYYPTSHIECTITKCEIM